MNVDRDCVSLERPVSMTAPSGHLPVLDGVRGLAAVLVVIMHTTVLDHPSSFAERAIHRAGTLGWVGVDIFFVLSGFLITGVLADARGGTRPLPNFYARRILR